MGSDLLHHIGKPGAVGQGLGERAPPPGALQALEPQQVEAQLSLLPSGILAEKSGRGKGLSSNSRGFV